MNDNLWWTIPRDDPLHFLVTLSLLSLLLELQTLFIHQLNLLPIQLLGLYLLLIEIYPSQYRRGYQHGVKGEEEFHEGEDARGNPVEQGDENEH